MSFKAKTHKLLKSEDGTGGANWAYVADQHPIEKCFEENFFSTCVANLLSGDRIFIVEKKNDIVTAACVAIVLAVSKKPQDYRVHLQPYDDNGIQRYSLEEPKSITPSEPETPPEKYVEGNGQVEWSIGTKEFNVKVNGETVFSSPDKGIARAVARGDMPIPQPDIFKE